MKRRVVARVLAFVFAILLCAAGVHAQSASTWFLAEGASNQLFSEEILVGNPSAQALSVRVTLLPAPDALAPITSKVYTLGPTARLTVSLASEFQLNGASSARVSAVIAGTSTPADIVVERSMYFPDATRPGAHNAGGVTRLAPNWTLAEGATGAFDTFVLVANPNPTATRVRATYLTALGARYTSEVIAPADGRVTFWPRSEHAALVAAEFSTFIESMTTGNDVVAERAMYFDSFRSGHDALGVSGPSTTWYFAEGFTGGNAQTAFETFLLLANTGSTSATVTVDYLLDSGQVVTRAYPVPARSRFTVWVDHEGRVYDARLADAAFGIRVTSSSPIVAERAMYWGTPSVGDPRTPTFPWIEGHDTAGVIAPAAKWGFAEGQQGNFGPGDTRFDSFFLLANPNPTPIGVRATFVREDGLGLVRVVCVAANARTNIWTAEYSPLTNQRFAAFVETVASATCGSVGGEEFVAERAVYIGPGFAAGHVNVGTPWTGTIATPPPAPNYVPPVTLTSVSPSVGPAAGGQTVQLTGSGFSAGATVSFGGAFASNVSVSSGGAATVVTPPHAAGLVSVTFTNATGQSSTLGGAFTYVAGPGLNSVFPSSGPVSGGTAVTLTGAGFVAGARVRFGGVEATGVVVTAPNAATAVTPARGAAGTVSVQVINPDGQSATLANGFAYTAPSVAFVQFTTRPGNTCLLLAWRHQPEDRREHRRSDGVFAAVAHVHRRVVGPRPPGPCDPDGCGSHRRRLRWRRGISTPLTGDLPVVRVKVDDRPACPGAVIARTNPLP